MIGLAKTWRFPPPNAPEYVKKAWKETTANMDGPDKAMLMANFMPGSLEDGAGSNTDSAYISPDAPYADMIKRALDWAKFCKNFDQSWQQEHREKQIQSLEQFLANVLAQQA